MSNSEFKAGFVNIIGLPNVGKSTLMNKLIGEKLSIITKKAQTTRHRILGIVNDENSQIIFSDTPGYIEKPAYKMQESMNNFVSSAMQDADIFLFMVELGTSPEKQEDIYKKLKDNETPVLLLVNKVDLSKNEEQVKAYLDLWQKILPKAETFIISAINNFNLDTVLGRIRKLLPVSPPYYDTDAFTDKSERFFVSEIIREKLLMLFKQEIPYSCEVDVEAFKEEKNIIRISAVIYTERPTQKSIIIGKGGESIKKVGTYARLDIEKFFDKKVFLELFVKVKEKWRNNDNELKKFGYK
ncbi:MAG: GTPase Era [Chitinophagales bacterium]